MTTPMLAKNRYKDQAGTELNIGDYVILAASGYGNDVHLRWGRITHYTKTGLMSVASRRPYDNGGVTGEYRGSHQSGSSMLRVAETSVPSSVLAELSQEEIKE